MDDNQIDDRNTQDILKPEGLAEHERLKTALWDHMVRLENNVAVLGDVISFKGLKMLGSGRLVLDWLGQNLYEYTIVIVWRLWDDSDPNSITLKRLRHVLHKYVRDEHKDMLYHRMRSLRPTAEVRDIFTRAEAVRHGRLAHIDHQYRFDETRRVAGISIANLRTATDFLTRYFDRLQFGVHSIFGLASFARRPDARSGTVRMMEDLVLRGPYSRRYDERGPDSWWRSFGAALSPEEVDWLSELRTRSGYSRIERPTG